MLIKALPFGFTMMYIPRGPILDYDDPEVIKQFFDGLKKSDAAIKRCLSKWIRALKSESIRLPIRPDQETATKIRAAARKRRRDFRGYSMKIEEAIQARFHSILDKPEDVLAAMPKRPAS